MQHIANALKAKCDVYFLAVEYFDRIITKHHRMPFDYMMNLMAASLIVALKKMEPLDFQELIVPYITAYYNSEYFRDSLERVNRLKRRQFIMSIYNIFECVYKQIHFSEQQSYRHQILQILRIVSVHPYFLEFNYSTLVASVLVMVLGPERGVKLSNIAPNLLLDCCYFLNPFMISIDMPYIYLTTTQFNTFIILAKVIRQETYMFQFNYNMIHEGFNIELLKLLRIWLKNRCKINPNRCTTLFY